MFRPFCFFTINQRNHRIRRAQYMCQDEEFLSLMASAKNTAETYGCKYYIVTKRICGFNTIFHFRVGGGLMSLPLSNFIRACHKLEKLIKLWRAELKTKIFLTFPASRRPSTPNSVWTSLQTAVLTHVLSPNIHFRLLMSSHIHINSCKHFGWTIPLNLIFMSSSESLS